MPPSSSAVAGTTPIKVPASSCQPPVSWSHRPPSLFLLLFTVLGPITAHLDTAHLDTAHLDTEHRVYLQLAHLDTGLLECLRQEERATGPPAFRQREPPAMEPLVEAQTSMVVSIGVVAANRSALAHPLEVPANALLLLTAAVGPSPRRRLRLSQAEGRKARRSRG